MDQVDVDVATVMVEDQVEVDQAEVDQAEVDQAEVENSCDYDLCCLKCAHQFNNTVA